MDMQQLEDKDLELKEKYNKLCAEQSTFRPKIGEDLVAEIRGFLKDLVDSGPVVVEFREDYYWLNMSYHQWCRYLNDRGIELGDLSYTLPKPQGQLRSLGGKEKSLRIRGKFITLLEQFTRGLWDIGEGTNTYFEEVVALLIDVFKVNAEKGFTTSQLLVIVQIIAKATELTLTDDDVEQCLDILDNAGIERIPTAQG